MVKYPSLDGLQCKVYMNKAELPEAQVLTDFNVVGNVWIGNSHNCEVITHSWLKRYLREYSGERTTPIKSKNYCT